LFYNTGISTYFWIVTNRKHRERRGKVQLVDARDVFVKMRKSLGNKRRLISPEQIGEITRLYGDFAEGDRVKIFPNEAFGYWKCVVERPLRFDEIEPSRAYTANELKVLKETAVSSERAHPVIKKIHPPGIRSDPLRGLFDISINGERRVVQYEPNPDRRDTEQVALLEKGGIEGYFSREVLPVAPDAWYVPDTVKVGYEISFARYFYKPPLLRSLDEITADILAAEGETDGLLAQILGAVS